MSDVIRALNIIIGHQPKAAADIASVGANKHFQVESRGNLDLGAGLTALRGFFVIVRAATGHLLVNVQVKHAAMYTDGLLL